VETDIQPYEPMRPVAEGLYCVDGSWRRSPLPRRMTVFVLRSGSLAIHSVVRMRENDMRDLEALGDVRWILVPNTFHCSEAGWYRSRYPESRLLVPARGRKALEAKVGRIDGTYEDDWPEELAGDLDVACTAGFKLEEAVFLHRPSRTLIATDLVFNQHGEDFPTLRRWVLTAAGAMNRFGPTRLFRYVFTTDRRALAESLRPVFDWDYDRVIMSHGRILEGGGSAAVRESFDWLHPVS